MFCFQTISSASRHVCNCRRLVFLVFVPVVAVFVLDLFVFLVLAANGQVVGFSFCVDFVSSYTVVRT